MSSSPKQIFNRDMSPCRVPKAEWNEESERQPPEAMPFSSYLTGSECEDNTVLQYAKSRGTSEIYDVIHTAIDELKSLKEEHIEHMSDVITSAIKELTLVNEKHGHNAVKTMYYDTLDKRGLLCILQNKEKGWEEGNREDKSVLRGLFHHTLGFDVYVYSSYSTLVSRLKSKDFDPYYCLLIFISAHGNEEGIQTDEGVKTNHRIANDFSNEKIKQLSGVPKIFILDVCRGKETNTTVYQDYSKTVPMKHGQFSQGDLVSPTTDSDCLIIHATTHGFKGFIRNTGSICLQGVIKVLKENWENDHLEEMLIDARMEVAKWSSEGRRQTLEIQTTLLKRLKFVKSC